MYRLFALTWEALLLFIIMFLLLFQLMVSLISLSFYVFCLYLRYWLLLILLCNIEASFLIVGRRDYSSNDLRDKLDRRHLSPRRYSPARDARGRQTIHGQTQSPYISACSHFFSTVSSFSYIMEVLILYHLNERFLFP